MRHILYKMRPAISQNLLCSILHEHTIGTLYFQARFEVHNFIELSYKDTGYLETLGFWLSEL